MENSPLDLGPLRLVYRAGRGSTAEVWRGVHRPSGAPVAVKVLRGFGPDGPGLADLAREVRAVAGLDHPAIIRLHDYGVLPASVEAAEQPELISGAPYFAMDWHGGGTLRDRQGGLQFPALVEHLLTVLDALGHAHARGVIHRDLKPANILLGDASAVLSDFGVVFSMHDPASDHRLSSGTPNYMAPEQVINDWRMFGPWTDLYAIGCIAWTMVTGRAPYAGFGARRAMRGHLSGRLPAFDPLVEVPGGFEGWLRRLLQREPRARFRFAADAIAGLRALSPVGGGTSRPAPTAVGDLGPEDMTRGMLDEADETALNASLDGSTWADGSTVGDGPEGFDASGPASPGLRFDPQSWRSPAPTGGVRLLDCGRVLAELRVPPLRGRSAEQAFLWRRLGEVRAGGGARAVVLEGATGTGKTALMGWLVAQAHASGQAESLRVMHLPGVQDRGVLETALLRRLRLDEMSPDAAFERGQTQLGLSPWAAAALAALGQPERAVQLETIHVNLPSERAVFAALADGLVGLAGGRAVVVQLDDTQWGEFALRFARFVLRRRPEAPVLFLLAVRAEAAPGPLLRQLEALQHLPTVDRRALTALDDAALEHAIDARLALTGPTRRRLLRTARGNPLFAAELIRFWVQTDALSTTADGHRLRGDRPDAWPPSPAHLWRARLDHLAAGVEPDPLPAIELAAVLGVEVDEREWAAARAAAGVTRPDAAVEAMLDAGMLQLPGPGRLVFAQTSLREALLQRARDAGRLRRWHRACAAALDVLGADGRVVEPGRCAGHLDAAGMPTQAFARWQAAINLSRERAGEMTPAVTPTLLGAARAARRMGMSRRDPRWLGLLISWSARCNFAQRGSGLRHARRALRGASALDDPTLEARALRHVGRTLMQLRRHDEARAMLERARAADTRAGDPVLVAETLHLLCHIATDRGDFAEAERLAHQALKLIEHDPGRSPPIYNTLGELYRAQGELDTAAEYYQQALEAVGDRDLVFRSIPEINLALIDLARDAFDTADERAERAARYAARIGDRLVRLYGETIRLVVAAERGAAGVWDRAWGGVSAALIGGFRDREHAMLLAQASRLAVETLPGRAPAARALAVAQLRVVGDDAAADALAAEGPSPGAADRTS